MDGREDVLAERRIAATERSVSHLQVYVPFPVVAVISPWNYPLILSFLDAVPALLAGCSVIIKPSEVTPRFIEIIHTILAEVPQLQPVVEILASSHLPGLGLSGRGVGFDEAQCGQDGPRHRRC